MSTHHSASCPNESSQTVEWAYLEWAQLLLHLPMISYSVHQQPGRVRPWVAHITSKTIMMTHPFYGASITNNY
jgi:hypothetical protein